jgi:3-methyladenine DNA glycosylase AlkD
MCTRIVRPSTENRSTKWTFEVTPGQVPRDLATGLGRVRLDARRAAEAELDRQLGERDGTDATGQHRARPADHVALALRGLEALADPAIRGQGPRYGIHSTNALGVPMSAIKALGKRLGTDHELALGLWDTGVYEARTLAGFVDDPALVTAAQMDAWAAGFDDWAIVDSSCFNLFDRAPDRWDMVPAWAVRQEEFVKRAAFALLWALALHDRTAHDDRFAATLPLMEPAATEPRNLVETAVNMALRAVGRMRPALRPDCLAIAERLAGSSDAPSRRTGRSALKELRTG